MNRVKKLIMMLIIMVLVLVFPYFIIVTSIGEYEGPEVKNGKILIEKFDSHKVYKLDGEWSFAWMAFNSLNEVNKKDLSNVLVPGVWNRVNNSKVVNNGYATYMMDIDIPELPKDMYALKIMNIGKAYRLYLNDQLLLESGIAGKEMKSTVDSNYPRVLPLPLLKENNRLVIEVSNYTSDGGGILQPVYFGSLDAINALDTKHNNLEFAMFITLSVVALFHFINFFNTRMVGRPNYGYFFIGVILLCMIAISSTVGEKFLLIIFGQSITPYLVKIMYVFSYISFVFHILFLNSLSHKKIPNLFVFITSLFLVFNASLLVVVPTFVIEIIRPVYLIASTLFFFTFLYYFVSYIRRRQVFNLSRGSQLSLFIGYYYLIIYNVCVNLYYRTVLQDYSISIVFIIGYCLLVSYSLSNQYANSYAQVEKAKEEIRIISRQKDEFLLNITNMISSPLSMMSTIMSGFLEEEGISIDQKTLVQVQYMRTNFDYMNQMLYDLLDFLKLKNNEIILEKGVYLLSDSIQLSIKSLGNNPEIADVNISCEIKDIDYYVNINMEKFIQCIRILIVNMVRKYNYKNIEVSLKTENEKAIVEIASKDKIDDYKLDKQISEKNYELISQKIVSKLFELMRCKVEYVDALNSAVKIIIPFSKSIENSATLNCVKESEINNWLRDFRTVNSDCNNILIVDDYNSNIFSWMTILENEGYSCYRLDRSVDLSDYASKLEKFSLVIIDGLLPNKKAYEITQSIRKKYKLLELPILMTLPYQNNHLIKEGYGLGVNDFLFKPFHKGYVLECVKSYMKVKMNQSALVESEMAFLYSQIRPHFIYNALNSISALCIINPTMASEITDQLCIFLRKLLEPVNSKKTVHISSELETVHAYINIEKARFGSKFEYIEDIDEDIGFNIPPLVIQPIVENSIRHGLKDIQTGGLIKLYIKKEKEAYKVTIEDNGSGFKESLTQNNLEGNGVGLMNINKRLRILYGSELEIETVKDVGTKVTFIVKEQGFD